MLRIVLKSDPDRLYDLIRRVRPLHRALRHAAAKAAETLAAEVTAAERAVLERLHDAGAQTVPDLAAHLGLGRQPVQRVVDRLRAGGFVHRQPNPRSLRSPHIALSRQGGIVIRRILSRQGAALARLARTIDRRDLEAAIRVADAILRGIPT